MTPSDPNEEPSAVPLFGSWRRAYLCVGLAFLIQVVLYYLLTLAVS